MTTLEDEETQRRGVISLLFSFGETIMGEHFDFEFHKRAPYHVECLPIRKCAMHICTDNSSANVLNAFKGIFLRSVEKATRARFRVHVGTQIECQYALVSFGIPVDTLPVTYSGELKKGNVMKRRYSYPALFSFTKSRCPLIHITHNILTRWI